MYSGAWVLMLISEQKPYFNLEERGDKLVTIYESVDYSNSIKVEMKIIDASMVLSPRQFVSVIEWRPIDTGFEMVLASVEHPKFSIPLKPSMFSRGTVRAIVNNRYRSSMLCESGFLFKMSSLASF